MACFIFWNIKKWRNKNRRSAVEVNSIKKYFIILKIPL